MIFKFMKNRWYGEISSFRETKPTPIYLDSGSKATVLSLQTTAQLLGCDVDRLSSYLSDKESTVVNGKKMVPCVLYDVAVCNKTIYSFYCMVPIKGKSVEDVLGADFISSCELSYDSNKNIELRDFSIHAHRHRFISQCGDAYLVKLTSL